MLTLLPTPTPQLPKNIIYPSIFVLLYYVSVQKCFTSRLSLNTDKYIVAAISEWILILQYSTCFYYSEPFIEVLYCILLSLAHFYNPLWGVVSDKSLSTVSYKNWQEMPHVPEVSLSLARHARLRTPTDRNPVRITSWVTFKVCAVPGC